MSGKSLNHSIGSGCKFAGMLVKKRAEIREIGSIVRQGVVSHQKGSFAVVTVVTVRYADDDDNLGDLRILAG